MSAGPCITHRDSFFRTTTDYIDSQVKLLKLLASKMDKEEQECLPLLLNVFYYRETLFIVYELLRDNLYHMRVSALCR